MPRTVLLVGGASSYRRAIRDVMRLEGVATIESESAPAAIALLKEAAFDAVLVCDEQRRLALQGLFGQIRKARPAPFVFLLPADGSDPAQLRSMAGGTSQLLDPAEDAEEHARLMLAALEGESATVSEPPLGRSAPANAVTVRAVPLSALGPAPAPRPSQGAGPPTVNMRGAPPNAVTVPGVLASEDLLSGAPTVETEAVPPGPNPSFASATPPLPAWALTTSAGLTDYARGLMVERGRAIEVTVAQRQGQPPVLLTTPTAAAAADVAWCGELMRSATLAAKIAHPNLPHVADVGTASVPYVASVHTPGMTLGRLVKRLGELDHGFTADGAAAVVADLLGALEAVHDARLFHGAISPRTLWVTHEGSVQLLYVGVAHLARIIEGKLRAQGQPTLGADYESPESVTDGVADARGDLFSAGVLCWELMSGERLFARADPDEARAAIAECKVPPLDVPKALEACVLRLLARDPDARPRSAAAAREELMAAMKEARTAQKSKGVMGRLFGKRGAAAGPRRLEAADPWSERALLVRLAATGAEA